MDKIILDAQTRDLTVKAKDLLVKGFVPVVFYGRGLKNLDLQVDYRFFRKVYKRAGNNTIIELKVDGKSSLDVLVHDVQYNPVTDEIMHVDFINVRMDEAIHTEIPLKLVGTAIAVKDLGGTLTSNLDVVKVKCLPKDLVHVIEVSIEPLVDFHTSIRVKDLVVPSGITVLTGADEVVATVVPMREEKEEVPVVAEGEGTAEGAGGVEGGVAEGTEGATVSTEGGVGASAEKK